MTKKLANPKPNQCITVNPAKAALTAQATKPMNTLPRTTFVNGINPFQSPIEVTPTKPEPIMQKPAKPAKTKIKLEDHSTPYKPPVQPTHDEHKASVQEHAIDDSIGFDIAITNDPLPPSRSAPLYKYRPKFESMAMGQALRMPTANVGKVAGAMRKWVEITGKKAHVKSMQRYCEDAGYGRVWLLDGVSKMVKRAKVSA